MLTEHLLRARVRLAHVRNARTLILGSGGGAGGSGIVAASMRTLAMRDCEIIERGGLTDQQRASATKVLVAKGCRGKAVFAHVVLQKGSEARYACDCFVEDIKWLGYCSLASRNDSEKAILAPFNATLKGLRLECGDLEKLQETHPGCVR